MFGAYEQGASNDDQSQVVEDGKGFLFSDSAWLVRGLDSSQHDILNDLTSRLSACSAPFSVADTARSNLCRASTCPRTTRVQGTMERRWTDRRWLQDVGRSPGEKSGTGWRAARKSPSHTVETTCTCRPPEISITRDVCVQPRS